MNKLLALLLLFLVTEFSFTQQKDHGYFDTILNDAEIFLNDGYSFYTYPLRMSGTDWIKTAGLGVGTYALIQSDDNIRTELGFEVNQYNTNFWKVIEKYGVIQYAEIAGAATYAVGLFGKNDDVRILGRMMVQALTYSGLTTMFIRMIAGRMRPPFTLDPLEFNGFETDNRFQSFPSGHVTVAFAFSTVLAEYFDSPWSRLGFYGLAGLTAAERLINVQHWTSDVVLGAFVGFAGGIFVINEERKRESKSQNKLSIFPTLNGINIRYSLN